MRYACILTVPKERGDVRTLLVVYVRYQARTRVRILSAFTECFKSQKEKEKILKLINNLVLTFRQGDFWRTVFALTVLPVVTCLIIFDDYHVI
jgi:hypothetical protein